MRDGLRQVRIKESFTLVQVFEFDTMLHNNGFTG